MARALLPLPPHDLRAVEPEQEQLAVRVQLAVHGRAGRRGGWRGWGGGWAAVGNYTLVTCPCPRLSVSAAVGRIW